MSPRGVELLAPTRADSDLQKFLDKKGEGVYAVAFRAEDPDKAKANAAKMGIRIMGDFTAPDGMGPMDGLREIWLHPKDCFGVYVMFTQGNPYHA